jgi:DNA-binding response OmpR family regulator
MSGEAVLIIEDDKYLNDLLSKKLQDEGFKLFSATDAEQGLKVIKDEGPDVILLDLLLPGMHGFEFLEMLKKDPKTKAIPVVIISNLGQKEDIEKGLALGAADYLVKAGVTLDGIVSMVNKVLSQSKKS